MKSLRLPLPLLTLLLAAPAYAADPTTSDCLSSSEKAITLANEHKLRAARAELLVCAAASCPADVRAECTRRVEEVNASMPTIVFEVEDGNRKHLSAVKVAMDGQPLVERLEGTALSIDPGVHVFTFAAAGQPPVDTQLVIYEGAKDRRERIVIGTPQGPANDVTTGAPAAPATPGASTAPRDTGATGSTQRLLGWTAVGAGGASLVAGLIFSVVGSSKRSDADSLCPTTCPTTDDRARFLRLQDSANSAETVSTIAFVAGGVFVAGGLALVFTAPNSSSAVALAPAVAPGFQGVAMTGSLW